MRQSLKEVQKIRSIGRTPLHDMTEDSFLFPRSDKKFGERQCYSVIHQNDSPTDFNFKRKVTQVKKDIYWELKNVTKKIKLAEGVVADLDAKLENELVALQ